MSREEQSKDGSFSENPQAFSSSFVGADAHIGPLGSCEFVEGFRKNRCILRADRVVRPYRESSVVVGADDSVGPSGSCEFAADFRKNGAICRGNVGIGPYNHTHKRVQIHRKFPKNQPHPAGRSRAPPLPGLGQIRTASQILNAEHSHKMKGSHYESSRYPREFRQCFH